MLHDACVESEAIRVAVSRNYYHRRLALLRFIHICRLECNTGSRFVSELPPGCELTLSSYLFGIIL